MFSPSPRNDDLGEKLYFAHKNFKANCCNAAKTARASGNDS